MKKIELYVSEGQPEEKEALTEAVQESEDDIAAGRVFSTEEIENEIAQWRKHIS